MAKLTYWVAPSDDNRAYNIRARTKREAEARRQEWGPEGYEPVRKVEVEYEGAFDLMEQCSGEGGGWWEH